MVVTVHLHTTLQRQTPTGALRRLEVTLPAGSRLADLLAHLDVAMSLDSILLVVNGRQAGVGQPLAEGDEIHLIPALSGGAPVPGSWGDPATPEDRRTRNGRTVHGQSRGSGANEESP